jgi:hypothetical protein
LVSAVVEKELNNHTQFCNTSMLNADIYRDMEASVYI